MARATPIIVGSTVAATASGNTISFTKASLPAMLDGDYLVAFLRCSTSVTTTLFSATGFTLLAPLAETVDANGRLIGAHGHLAATAASEPTTYDFTFTGTAGRISGVLLLVRGVDPAAPVSGVANGAANYYSHGVVPWTTTVGSLILAAVANEVVTPNVSEPTQDPDYALVVNQPHTTGTAVTRTVVNVASKVADSTAAPSSSGTVWTSTSSLAYWSLSLQGPDVVVPPPTGLAVKIGTGAAASMTVLVGASRLAPVKARQIMPGFANVTAMLAKPGVTMGHRGASGVAGYPEMSQRSYDYLIQRGYGILEFSANRTSDGVWVGCHDADLNRTSQTTGLPNISTQTWATVQTFTNSLNSGGVPQPYYRMDDFLTKYVPYQIVMVDPKFSNSGPNIAEFLNMCDAHGGPARIIIKYSGVGAGSVFIADQATLRGYQTWGYFYDADVADGDLAAWQSHWSILGMEVGATGPSWTAALSYGKPVIGHIAASQANYNTCIANGARIVQCSRPDLITPVSVWT